VYFALKEESHTRDLLVAHNRSTRIIIVIIIIIINIIESESSIADVDE